MYVALLGPDPIFGKDRRDNACIRRRGLQKDEEWGQRWCVVVLGASMGPGVPKGFRLCLLLPSPRVLVSPPCTALTNGGHHGTDSDCWPSLVRIQITLGLPAYLAWPSLCAMPLLASGNTIAVPPATQISNLHTQYKGGYMCGLLALYGQSEGSHTCYAKKLAIRTCTPLYVMTLFQLVARFQC